MFPSCKYLLRHDLDNWVGLSKTVMVEDGLSDIAGHGIDGNSYDEVCYKYCRILDTQFPTAILACSVREDIIKQLNIRSPTLRIFVTSFNRPNLHYEVRFKPPDNDPFP